LEQPGPGLLETKTRAKVEIKMMLDGLAQLIQVQE